MPREGNIFHIASSGDDGKVKVIMITGEEMANPEYEERPEPLQGLDAVIPFFFKGAGIPRPHKKKTDSAATNAEDGEAPPTKEADVEAAMMEGEEDVEIEDDGEDDEEEEEEEEDKFVHLDLHS